MGKFCMNCGCKIQDDFKICPYCYKDVREPSKPIESKEPILEEKSIEFNDVRSKDKKIRTIAVISILIIMITAIVGIFILVDWDSDELYNLTEISYGTSFLSSDSDYDGLSDYEEIYEYYLDPLDPDSDNDNLDDGEEINIFGTDPNNVDTDGDGYRDGSDPHPTEHEWKYIDSDGDGWSDYKEYYETGTSVYDSDTDGDGIPDPKDSDPSVATSSHQIYREFEWDYPHDYWNKKTWTWELTFSRDLYNYKSQLPRLNYYADWAEYTVDSTVTSLANGLKEAAEEGGFDDYQTVSFILAFVQSLPYTEDDVTTGSDDYPRYPIETLVDGGGDCEDMSFLFAGIIKELNYGVCLINPPGHVAVGVLGSETLSGVYYELDGKRYYYCETTGSGWEIGDCPDEYLDESAKLIKL